MILATTTKDFLRIYPDKKMPYISFALYEQLCLKEGVECDATCDNSVANKVDAI